jgi:hypothetical protein
VTVYDPELFGDSEPEDAWCPTDRVGVLLNNLRRRIAALDGWPVDFSDDLDDIAGACSRSCKPTPSSHRAPSSAPICCSTICNMSVAVWRNYDGLYLLDLADVCRRAVGDEVFEVEGWEYRARSSGGYADGRPWCVMWHHTASDTDPANDVEYICYGNPDAPVANLYIDRDGAVWVCAGGATNTNGKGGPFTVSRGTVPLDQMNTYAVSMEIANAGTGQPWPQRQVDAAMAVLVGGVRRLRTRPPPTWAPITVV